MEVLANSDEVCLVPLLSLLCWCMVAPRNGYGLCKRLGKWDCPPCYLCLRLLEDACQNTWNTLRNFLLSSLIWEVTQQAPKLLLLHYRNCEERWSVSRLNPTIINKPLSQNIKDGINGSMPSLRVFHQRVCFPDIQPWGIACSFVSDSYGRSEEFWSCQAVIPWF